VLDFGTKTMEGIKNTATLGTAVTARRRPPRVFGPEGELTRYEMALADGLELLKVATGKRPALAVDQYQWHMNLHKGGVLLLTDRHALKMKRRTSGGPDLKWSLALRHIERVELRDVTVLVTVASVAKHAFEMGAQRKLTALSANDSAQAHARLVRAAEAARQQAQAAGTLGKPDEGDELFF
jgi:hypothetical protein